MALGTDESPNIIGRKPERALVHTFANSGAPQALILAGPPGIGKTTLWEAACETMSAHGFAILAAQPAEPETRLSLAALADLLETVDDELVAELPTPQRAAIDVALLRAEPTGPPPDPRLIATAFLGVLRRLAGSQRVCLAIDDVHWLDSASAEVLAFAARRLRDHPVRFLLAERSGARATITRAFRPGELERIEVGPLSLGATRHMLTERLALSLPRRTLRRLHELTGGNPLFTLELGRTLVEGGAPAIGDDLSVPETIEEFLGVRVAALPKRARAALLAVSLGAGSLGQLKTVVGREAVDEGFEVGVVVREEERVRASHPLLAAAARDQARPNDRRELHRALANIVDDPEIAALHQALATDGPDADLASKVAEAATAAAKRGAAADAARLAHHALRLTPAGTVDRAEKLVSLAEYLAVAGEGKPAVDLLRDALVTIPEGPTRARAHLIIAENRSRPWPWEEAEWHYDAALAHCAAESGLRAIILARKSRHAAVARLERIQAAEAWALDALPAARAVGRSAEQEVLHSLAWARILRGLPVDDVRARFAEVSDGAVEVVRSLERVAAERHVHRGELQPARTILNDLLALADAREEEFSYEWLRMSLCELELRAGNWDAAERLLDESRESLDVDHVLAPAYRRHRAHVAVGRNADKAEWWAGDDHPEAHSRWDVFATGWIEGIAALSAREPERALAALAPVWEHTRREGIDDPGVFPVAPDLAEALLELGRDEEADAIVGRLERLSRMQEHPWGLASTERSSSLIAFARGGDPDAAARRGAAAADAYERLGLRFDSARTLLALGRAQRRLRRWREARRALERAQAAFTALASSEWAEQAAVELARVGGRRAVPAGTLTPSERQVAELAAQGRTNQEIARTLYVSPHTVDTHLRRAYAKLGIRRRSELARQLETSA